MALQQNYHHLWFVSFRLLKTAGHRDDVQLKLKPNQNLPPEVISECKARGIDPFSLLTECKKDFLKKYPVGTEFLLEAKLTDRKGGTMFFYSSYRRSAIKIIEPS